jgi:hypothetical protein
MAILAQQTVWQTVTLQHVSRLVLALVLLYHNMFELRCATGELAAGNCSSCCIHKLWQRIILSSDPRGGHTAHANSTGSCTRNSLIVLRLHMAGLCESTILRLPIPESACFIAFECYPDYCLVQAAKCHRAIL